MKMDIEDLIEENDLITTKKIAEEVDAHFNTIRKTLKDMDY
jgi:hypothetical protein